MGWSQGVDATLACSLSAGVRNPKVCRGRVLSRRAISSNSDCENLERSAFFGRYCRSRPFVFSFEPRCHRTFRASTAINPISTIAAASPLFSTALLGGGFRKRSFRGPGLSRGICSRFRGASRDLVLYSHNPAASNWGMPYLAVQYPRQAEDLLGAPIFQAYPPRPPL
jgi:hypothetical protein